ncbi:M20/M25/M40 family metallo-hydrolase [Propionimicrobium sp. PCR01-08-3]|uniref:M20/M25/M40 family metallo-hydrolase n=1 Tax=Propionimicrobium sp. PCR01-08-3 TaxID=3052086 RepID=UPI00255CC7D7|nr:M20/M25/M40 family metallo-hydrolase [Propionimicrobium sp. PCR01-08-3]WIY81922.1 M20/M25/M40 family metallo-hydrolase [Propionimicrobium sp. PCR01-08-3]
MVDVAALRERTEAVLPSVTDDLIKLVAIPSISAQPEHADDVMAAANAIVSHLKALDCDRVKIVQAGGQPAVIAHFDVDPGKPTVCLYAHMDVQPTGDLAHWSSEPFKADRRGDRLFGRGTADDKAGVAAHLAALRAFGGKPPVNVTVLIEGEEEMGSPTLGRILAENADELKADLYVVADCGNWGIGEPAFTTSLRGVVDCTVELRTLSHAIHSGEFGGVVPDALTTLCRLLATLHDADGNVAVEGLVSSEDTDVEQTPESVRQDSAVLDSVQLIGSGPVASRTWLKPAISVIGLDTTPIATSSNTLIPSASARISVRIAPGDTGANALACLRKHLEENVDWGAQLVFTDGEAAEPTRTRLDPEVIDKANWAWHEAFGIDPMQIGTGGSIGMIAEFQEMFPQASVLATAVSDPDCRMHGIDESLYLPDWEAVCLAEALLLAALGE